MKVFGFKIHRKDEQDIFSADNQLERSEKNINRLSTVISPENDDGSFTIDTLYNAYILNSAISINFNDDIDLIKNYRALAENSEVDRAIDEIVNECIVLEDNYDVIYIDLDPLTFVSDSFKDLVRNEFNFIIKLLKFNTQAYNIFRQWYIDGRYYFNIVIDFDHPEKGIQELIPISPFHIRKIREIVKERNQNNVEIIKEIREYFVYDNTGQFGGQVLKIPLDSICYVHSGLVDDDKGTVLSYLHKALKPINQLRLMEDGMIIYRLARAPERRVFYVDVGDLPKAKAEQYVKSLMGRFKNKLSYDAISGNVRDSRNQLSMMEDFWIPRRSEGRTTEIQTLPPACLDMNTVIYLMDSRCLTITQIAEELAEGHTLWAMSICTETYQIKPGLISWAGVTRTQCQVMKLILSNGHDLICTPDHTFPIENKGRVKAEDLIEGDMFLGTYHNVQLKTCIYLDELMDVGTLTIDQDEIYHNYHNFYIFNGIFVNNSNTDNTNEVKYFQDKVYNALNVPITRLNSDTSSGMNLGRQAEITRDELKFTKFVRRLQAQFSILFYTLLRIQLLLKNIVSIDDWEDIKDFIKFEYEKDNFYTDSKNAAILKDKLEILSSIDQFVGKYFSKEFVFKEVMNLSDDEIENIKTQMKTDIDDEKKATEEPESNDNIESESMGDFSSSFESSENTEEPTEKESSSKKSEINQEVEKQSSNPPPA